MSINWDMAGRGNNALAYFQLGQQLGQQVIDGRVNRAVGKIMQADQPGQMPNGQAPDLSGEWETVARYNPEMAFKMKQRQAEQAEAARKRQATELEARRARLTDMAKLFDGVTPENYGQRLQIAQRMGIDTTGAPQVYDPNWVQQNAVITRFAAENPDKLPLIAQEFQAAGIDLNTPQGKEALLNAIAGKYGSEYVDENGNVRRRAAFDPKTFTQSTQPAGGGIQEGATATNPQTGQKIIFRNGQWQPMGGQPAGSVPFQQ